MNRTQSHDNKNEHDKSDDSNSDNDCNDGMARNDANMTLMLVILDAHGCRQCLVAPHSGIDSFVSKIMLEPGATFTPTSS